jgi:hypothetical protein
LEEFSSRTFFDKGPAPFTVRIQNTGIHSIKPKGEITIKNMFGQSVGKLDLSAVNVLSNSIRAIPNGTYAQELRAGGNLNTKTKSSLDFRRPVALWKENFLLGLYAATLSISMSNEGPTLTKAIHFFAFPIQGFIIIIIISILVIIFRKKIRIHMNKNRT